MFNAWYACLIEIRNATGQITGVKLDEKLPKGYIDVTLQSITCNYDLETLKRDFRDATEIGEEILNDKVTEFSNCDKKKVFRGKYEMQFLIKFIQLLLEDAKTSKSVVSSKINYAFNDNLNNQQAINIFEGYAETPQSLIDYLQMVTQ